MTTFVGIVEVVKGVSVVVACFVAVYGIDAWRREFVGKRRMELAEEVLALFYEARGILQDIRNPMTFVGEEAGRQPAPNENADQKFILDRAFVVLRRIDANRATFSRILAVRYRFMAHHGAEAAAPFNKLIGIVNEVAAAAHGMTVRTIATPAVPESTPDNPDRIGDHLRNVLWQFLDGDPIQPRVDAIVEEMERICGGIINSKGTLFGALNADVSGVPRMWWRRAVRIFGRGK